MIIPGSEMNDDNDANNNNTKSDVNTLGTFYEIFYISNSYNNCVRYHLPLFCFKFNSTIGSQK